MRRTDNLTTFICRLSWNLGASTSWNLQGLSRTVMRLLYLLLFTICEKSILTLNNNRSDFSVRQVLFVYKPWICSYTTTETISIKSSSRNTIKKQYISVYIFQEREAKISWQLNFFFWLVSASVSYDISAWQKSSSFAEVLLKIKYRKKGGRAVLTSQIRHVSPSFAKSVRLHALNSETYF